MLWVWILERTATLWDWTAKSAAYEKSVLFHFPGADRCSPVGSQTYFVTPGFELVTR